MTPISETDNTWQAKDCTSTITKICKIVQRLLLPFCLHSCAWSLIICSLIIRSAVQLGRSFARDIMSQHRLRYLQTYIVLCSLVALAFSSCENSSPSTCSADANTSKKIAVVQILDNTHGLKVEKKLITTKRFQQLLQDSGQGEFCCSSCWPLSTPCSGQSAALTVAATGNHAVLSHNCVPARLNTVNCTVWCRLCSIHHMQVRR